MAKYQAVAMGEVCWEVEGGVEDHPIQSDHPHLS